jgi:hypothetical protein
MGEFESETLTDELTIVQTGNQLSSVARPAAIGDLGYEIRGLVDQNGGIRGDWWATGRERSVRGQFDGNLDASGSIVHAHFSENYELRPYSWLWTKKGSGAR